MRKIFHQMSFLKRIEHLNKKISYKFLDLIFRNKEEKIPLDPARIKKILLFRYDAIGDMIVTTPVFRLIKEKIPDAEIHVVCSPYNYPVIQHDERVKKFFLHDGTTTSFWKLVRTAGKEQYDLVLAYVLFRTTYAGFMANLIGGRKATKVTVLHKARKKLYSTFFNVQIELERDKCTMAELQVKMLCAVFGWKYDKSLVKMDICLDENSRAAAQKFCEKNSLNNFFVLNISAGREYRRWSVVKNREFLEKIFSQIPEQNFVLITAPADLAEAEAIAKNFPQVKIFPPTKNFLEICALVERSSLVVSPDTSIVHVASAFRKPTLAFYSYATTYVMEWLPFGVPNKILISENKQPIETIPTDAAVEKFFELRENISFTD